MLYYMNVNIPKNNRQTTFWKLFGPILGQVFVSQFRLLCYDTISRTTWCPVKMFQIPITNG